MADVLPPVSGAHLECVIQISTSLQIAIVWEQCRELASREAPGRTPTTLVFEISGAAARLLASTALSLSIEVRKGAVVLEEHERLEVCPGEPMSGHTDNGTAEPILWEVGLFSISSQGESLASAPDCFVRTLGTDRNVTKSFEAKA
ncbi:MAG: hypothetical protein JNJ88_02475 [Planctomycetes bacterium]|nr:hypothetical protein [Planctomycetota bacterium]